jgi:hypothetical protein
MRQFALALALALLFVSLARSDDRLPQPQLPAEVEYLRKNPNDIKALQAYLKAAAREINMLTDNDPPKAERALADFEVTLAIIHPTSDEAKAIIARAKKLLPERAREIAFAKLTLADLEKELTAHPNEVSSFQNWWRKLEAELRYRDIAHPPEAQSKLYAAKTFVARIKSQTNDEKVRKECESFLTYTALNLQEQVIKHAQSLAAIVGTDARKLEVKSWVNGPPPSVDDLKGKVVLLEFGSVGDNRGLVNLPYFRKWQERFTDKGLVFVSLVKLSKSSLWDEEGQRLMSLERVTYTPQQQQESLKQMFAFYKLKHYLAIMRDRNGTYDYGLNNAGMVVIDRLGKVRMVRVHSTERNTRDIDKLLAEMFEPAADQK